MLSAGHATSGADDDRGGKSTNLLAADCWPIFKRNYLRQLHGPASGRAIETLNRILQPIGAGRYQDNPIALFNGVGSHRYHGFGKRRLREALLTTLRVLSGCCTKFGNTYSRRSEPRCAKCM